MRTLMKAAGKEPSLRDKSRWLTYTPPVQRRPKYPLQAYRRKKTRLWPWVLTGALLPLFAWVLWTHVLPASWKNRVEQRAQKSPEPVLPVRHPGAQAPGKEEPSPKAHLALTNPPIAAPIQSTQAPPVLVKEPVQPTPDKRRLPSYLAAQSVDYPRRPCCIFEVQLALARLRFSPGSIDGVMGSQTRAALRAFQREKRLPETGEADDATLAELKVEWAPFEEIAVTQELLGKLQPLSKSWLGKSQQSALAYETLLECLSERSQASPTFVRMLNSNFNWSQPTLGGLVRIPGLPHEPAPTKAALLHIKLHDRVMQAQDSEGTILAHFPCSIAQRVDKRPVGELHVQVIVPSPNYTFDPEVFPESEEGRQLGRKLVLPPGPNNPVGVAWIGLDKPGYGIHGTPQPEQVGRTESHGCFRLANWNAEYLISLAWIGMPVLVEP